TLEVDSGGFRLKGRAGLGKAPFDIVWDENFEQKPGSPYRHVTATGSVRGEQWKNLGVDAFEGTKGPVNVSIEMSKPSKTKTVISGTVDMTPAALNVDMLKWKKPARERAVLKFTATAPDGEPVRIAPITLRGSDVSATGNATLSSDMSQLLSFSFPKLVLGRTNASLEFAQSFGKDGALRLDATGTSLDVSGLRGGNDPGKEDPRPKEYRIKIDKLYTSETGIIDKAHVFAARDKAGWRSIDFHGESEGVPLSIELTPKADGTRTFAIFCDDFGTAMAGLGFTDTIEGGKLIVTGKSTPENARIIKGNIKIKEFTVTNLPVLALLLNATSPFGITGILTNSASFSLLKGQYTWKGDAISLEKTHATGAAVGINIEGDVDMNSGEAKLRGTVVPFSEINKVINAIPIIGDLLTGGENQGILAVAYEIKGPLSSPGISVNPGSLLTPGFLRNVFFGDSDDENEEE
ncbi:MAG: AsmA-like C-terminal domain-containing protein, partial [Alphaproteobacteria bacterium]|nr:AsmA-like C-terminal domain-containing protein [Alphaproteobacteria bacterium]